MSEDAGFKQQHAWRSKFRSRHHDIAHEQVAEDAHDWQGRENIFRGKASLVSRPQELAELIERLRAAGSFAYDSEFIGEMSYLPKLCLIQIGTEQEIALVDPLAEMDLTPIWELLCDPSVQKIVHAGAQDLEPALRALGRPAVNVVDTQIAAGFARLPYPISLQRITLQMLGIRLGKGLTFTHWDQRPLSAQQVRYAGDDVRFLPAVWGELRGILEPSGNFRWLEEECIAMARSSPYQFDPETSYQRVRGSGALDPRQMGILRELAIWRDGGAREADLPPRSYLRDEIMIDLCRRAPGDEEKLMNIQGLPRPIRVAHGQAIVEAIARGKARPVDVGGEIRKSDELPRQQFQTDSIHALAQTLCMARGIDPQLAMTRGDTGELLARIREGGSVEGCRLMQGWRREVVGKGIWELCKTGGKVGLTVQQMELGQG